MQNERGKDCTLEIAMINGSSRELSERQSQREGNPPGEVINPDANQNIPNYNYFREHHHRMSVIQFDLAFHVVSNKACLSVKCSINTRFGQVEMRSGLTHCQSSHQN